MEEPKQAQSITSTQLPNPPPTATSQPPPPSLPPKPKKRPLHNDSPFPNSNCFFKIRALLKDVRPHFLEVLRTPDFRSCKAAREIQEQMKLLMELYKQMTAETIAIGKNTTENQPLSGESKDGPKAQEKPQDVTTDQPKSNNLFAKPSAGPEKLRADDGEVSGSYIVGGSAFGWNFITFTSKDSVYYGVTKESFRASKSSVVEPDKVVRVK